MIQYYNKQNGYIILVDKHAVCVKYTVSEKLVAFELHNISKFLWIMFITI